MRNTALWSAGLLAGGSVMLPGCTPLSYVSYRRKGDHLVVSKADMGEHQYVLLNTPHLPASVYLRRQKDGGYMALLLECTHLSCEVEPYGSSLHCPCHGSVFSTSGKVREGPAESDLKTFNVHEDDEHIYIE